MALSLFPSRPRRATADLSRALTLYTSQVLPGSPAHRDWPITNPWISSAFTGGRPADERHWLTMEQTPAIRGAMATRIAQLLGGGIKLEPGKGEGAEELLDFWSFVLSEHKLLTVIAISLRSMFRGWECFEAVGAWRDWDGKRVYTPVILRDALTWQFRFTASRDLIYCPGGLAVAGYRRDTLPAKMKFWAPAIGMTLANPYGDPLHHYAAAVEFAYRELSEAGLVQLKQAQGYQTAETEADLNSPSGAASLLELETQIAKMQASGILVIPQGWRVGWQELTEAVGGWINLFEYFDNTLRTFYSGGNLTTSATGASGNRALGEVQERMSRRLSAVDAEQDIESFRCDFMRPWSAWNAEIISPAFRATRATPSLEDVPLRAIPRLSFRSLHRLRPDDLAALQAIVDGGVIDNEGDGAVRVDVREILELSRIPLLDEGEDGATLDLAKKIPPPAPFGAQDLPLGDRRGDPGTAPDDDETARR